MSCEDVTTADVSNVCRRLHFGNVSKERQDVACPEKPLRPGSKDVGATASLLIWIRDARISERDACALCSTTISTTCALPTRAESHEAFQCTALLYCVSYMPLGLLFLWRVQQLALHGCCLGGWSPFLQSVCSSLWFLIIRRSSPSLGDAATCACHRRSAVRLRFDYRGVSKSNQHLRNLLESARTLVASNIYDFYY